jgi:hypothetical protein
VGAIKKTGGIFMKKSFLVLLLMIVISLPVLVSAEEQIIPQNSQMASINLFYISSTASLPIYANGLLITVLDSKNYVSFSVPSGQLKLSCYFPSKIYTEDLFKVDPGKTYYVTLKLWSRKVTYQFITKQEAEELFNKFKTFNPTYHN